MIEFCHNRRKFGHDINCKRTEISQVKFVAKKYFYVATNTSTNDKDQRRKVCCDKRKFCLDRNCLGIKEILSRHRKLCHDRIDKLKRKILVTTLSKSVVTKSKEKAQRTGRDKKLYAKTEASDKDWKLCRDVMLYVVPKHLIWAIILGIHNTINEVWPNIGKSINRCM